MTPIPGIYQRKSGQIHLFFDRLSFQFDESPEPSVEIRKSDLVLSLAGRNRPTVHMASRLNPGEPITTSDRGILNELSKMGFESAQEILEAYERKRSFRMKSLGAFFGGIFIILVLIPWLSAYVPSTWVEKLISKEQERRIFHSRSLSVLQPKNVFPSQHPANEDLRLLVDFLTKASPELRNMEVDIEVGRSNEMNAFAFPGGTLVVNEGLIRESESIDEVLGVIGHELGHIEQRHTLKAMGGAVSLLTGTLILSFFIGTDASVWITKGFDLGQLKFSRDHEREADQRAVVFLRNAGISPQGLISFFEKLSSKHGDLKALSLFSTHPMSSERMQTLRTVARDSTGPSAAAPITMDQLKSALGGE